MSQSPAEVSEVQPVRVQRPHDPARGALRLVSFCPVENGIYAGMHAMSRALVAAGVPQYRLQRFRAIETFARATGRFKINRALLRLRGRACIALMGWPNDGRAFPYNWVFETIPWICDCWPHDYHKWEQLFRRNRVRIAFISARGSAAYFRERIPEMTTVWMPEACDPAEYFPHAPLAERPTHVLELGRKHESYHAPVAAALARAGLTHRFSIDGSRTPVFVDQPALYRGLGDTAVSVCFPKSVTHPDIAGGLETVTLRYFESIASRCLVVGRCPAELRDLFGFSPVIEADPRDPAGQLLSILGSLDSYQSFADRAHQRLLEVGSAEARVQDMLRCLHDHGWSVGS